MTLWLNSFNAPTFDISDGIATSCLRLSENKQIPQCTWPVGSCPIILMNMLLANTLGKREYCVRCRVSICFCWTDLQRDNSLDKLCVKICVIWIYVCLDHLYDPWYQYSFWLLNKAMHSRLCLWLPVFWHCISLSNKVLHELVDLYVRCWGSNAENN